MLKELILGLAEGAVGGVLFLALVWAAMIGAGAALGGLILLFL